MPVQAGRIESYLKSLVEFEMSTLRKPHPTTFLVLHLNISRIRESAPAGVRFTEYVYVDDGKKDFSCWVTPSGLMVREPGACNAD